MSFTARRQLRSLSDDDVDDDVLAEYCPTCYLLLNSSGLTLGLEEAEEENNHLMKGHW